ncbi:MAG: cytochrome c biogenesis protein CcsA [Chitinophagaceae bacterium]
MDFIGENLLPGKLGHFFILLSLVASIAASVSYFLSVQNKDEAQKLQWKKLARIFFIAEVISVFAIIGLVLTLIYNHNFAYKYVWQHSSLSLEPKYLLSSFWEGQEGSFLLWSFWHCVLGLVVIAREKVWEGPVMAVISFVQAFLASMLVGFTVFGAKVGSNPFVLLRNEFDLKAQIPVLNDPENYRNYLSFITDGNDLNPLLQNYWMVIHPPVLFLGFAATVVPFAFAIAGLWTRDFKGWINRALPWALFGAAALGLGIMMGAAWAYESLNFGGYWAWDPVENASLVPWLILVAGIHTLLIFKHTGYSLHSTYTFLILSFLFVLYSTFLTRSGILGDTSVHAFTDLGMNGQIFMLMYSFIWMPVVASGKNLRNRLLYTGLAIALAIIAYFLPVIAFASIFLAIVLWQVAQNKNVPQTIKKEEETSSREFWMFVGSLVIFLSAALIIGMTSIPVFNKFMSLVTGDEKLMEPLAMGEDSAFAYNRIQIFVAVVLGLLTAVTQYLKYKNTANSFFFKKILWPTVASVVIASLILAFGDINYRENGLGYLGAIWLAIVASVYAIIANGAYIWIGLKGKLKVSGGSISHLGFGMMLLGILISSSKKEVLSYNTSGIFVPMGEGSKEKPGENLTLVRGLRTDMGSYWVTYEKDSTHPKKPLWYYSLKFEDKANGKDFTLRPNAFINYKGNEGLMANPDAKHYWDHDVFTYITSLPDPTKEIKDTAQFKPVEVTIGDTVFYSKGFAVLEEVKSHKNIPNAQMTEKDSASVATVKVFAKTESIYTMQPILINKGGATYTQPDSVTAESLIIQLQKVEGNKAELGIKETDAIMQYVTLKALKFPFINLLWLGTIIMIIGIIMSMVVRVQKNRASLRKI